MAKIIRDMEGGPLTTEHERYHRRARIGQSLRVLESPIVQYHLNCFLHTSEEVSYEEVLERIIVEQSRLLKRLEESLAWHKVSAPLVILEEGVERARDLAGAFRREK